MEGAESMEDYDLLEALPVEFTREVELIPFHAAKVPKAGKKGLERVGGQGRRCLQRDMGVSKNSGTPKSSILIGFSIVNHPFWGTPIFGNTHMFSVCVKKMTHFFS